MPSLAKNLACLLICAPLTSIWGLDTSNTTQCGVYLAQSTIPGAGLGLFAGRDYEESENVLEDLAIAISDIMMHSSMKGSFLWDEYTWSAGSLKMHGEGVDEVNVASPGFGAAANCMLALVNVEEGTPRNINMFDRRKDPGAGASTTFHHRQTSTSQQVRAGEEFFVSYGSNWFTSRPQLGPIPLEDEFDTATGLLRSLFSLDVPITVREDLWQDFFLQTQFDDSRVLVGALRGYDPEHLNREFNSDLKAAKRSESKRSLEDLEQRGSCADHLRVAQSTLPQAGMGAVANRFLPEGTKVATLPMVHITNRTVLNMYKLSPNDATTVLRDTQTGYQLLLNYCYGHGQSSMLLCPYGPLVNYVNHNQTRANVKLQWVPDAASNHQPDRLDWTIEQFEASDATAKLAMEFVALRDIEEGEEVFLDYGDEWEEAWQRHLSRWRPDSASNSYTSAATRNERIQPQVPLATVFDDILLKSYTASVTTDLQCDTALGESREEWEPFYRNGTLVEYLGEEEARWSPCEILRYRVDPSGDILYSVHLFERDDGEMVQSRLVENVPSLIFHYIDRPYTQDAFLPNVFRHDLRIPDDIFPSSWRNLVEKGSS